MPEVQLTDQQSTFYALVQQSSTGGKRTPMDTPAVAKGYAGKIL